MKKMLKKGLCVLLSIAMLFSALPISTLAARAEQPEAMEYTTSDGEKQEISTDEWAEKFPYGTFAFSNSEVTLKEKGESQTISIYRLGGTLGRATALVSYIPFLSETEEELSQANAIGEEDIEILVEEPAPNVFSQRVGKDKDPTKAPLGVEISLSSTDPRGTDGNDEADAELENTVYLSANVSAESYQWYAKYDGIWKIIDGADELALPIAKEDLEQVDIRLQYTQAGETYCTNSYDGEEYIELDNHYLASEIAQTEDYIPTYKSLSLTPDESGKVKFEVVFGEGEWKKDIEISPNDNDQTDAVRMGTLLIYGNEGGELHDTANTVLISLLDDEEIEAASFGFEITKIYADISEGKVVATVRRKGSNTHVTTLDYETTDGEALAGVDYVAKSGTLYFYDNDEQTIEIALINKHLLEDNSRTEQTEQELEELLQDEAALKDFGIKLLNIKGGEGKDSFDEGLEAATVRLFDSGKPVSSSAEDSETQMHTPGAIDLTASTTTSDTALIPESKTLTGEEIEQPQEEEIITTVTPPEETTLEDTLDVAGNARSIVAAAAAISVSEANSVAFRRENLGYSSGKYWNNALTLVAQEAGKDLKRDWSNITSVTETAVTLKGSRGAEATLSIPHLTEMYSAVQVISNQQAYNSGIFSDVRVFPEIHIMKGTTPFYTFPQPGNGWYGIKMLHETSYTGVNQWIDFNTIDPAVDKLMLKIKENDDDYSSLYDAYVTLTYGNIPRRVFSQSKNVNLKIHSANDTENVKAGEASDAESLFKFNGNLGIVEHNGGVNELGEIFVGSQITVDPTLTGPYTFDGSEKSLYLTADNASLYQTNSFRTAGNGGVLTLLWDGFKIQHAQNDKLTIHTVYNRNQEIDLNLSRAVIQADGESQADATNRAINDFKSSVTGGKISYGYKTYNIATRKFENKEGSQTVNDKQYGNGDAGLRTLFEKVDNLQWINFNLPAEDKIVFSGESYDGNAKIYLNTADFSLNTLRFSYWPVEALAIEFPAQVQIDGAYVYIDKNKDGKINGHFDSATGNFVLAPNTDILYKQIDLTTNEDESVFAPIRIDGEVYNKIMKVHYVVLPRCLTAPPDKEDVRGQILTAFTHNVTNANSLADLTNEQKTYRYIKTLKGKLSESAEEKHLSDDILIYTAKASSPSMLDFPLGGDKNPYTIEGSKVIWTPDFEGNMLFEYENPEPITLKDTILGDDLDLTNDYTYSAAEGFKYNNPTALEMINGYLGSYAGNSVFSLVLREQSEAETMDKLSDGSFDPSNFTTEFESTCLGGKGTYPTPGGLLHMDSGKAPAMDFNSSKDDDSVPEGFDVDMGINLPQINFENFLGFDGISFFMEGNRIGFTVGTPIANKTNDPTSSAAKDNFNLADKLNQGNKIFEESDDNWYEDDEDEGTEDGQIKSKDYGVSLSASAAFFWEYDPVMDSFVFAEAAISLKASFEFSLQYRFAFCPLIYIYVKTGVGVSLGVGLGHEYREEEDNKEDSGTTKLYTEIGAGGVLDPSDSLGISASIKAEDAENNRLFFKTKKNAKALNLYFTGKVLIEFFDDTGKVIRKGTLTSNANGSPEKINIDKTLKNLENRETYNVCLTAIKDSTIHKVKSVSEYVENVYFKGVEVSPELFIEIGAGIGMDILKAEVFIKVNVNASFLFAAYKGYYGGQNNYEAFSVNSFDFSASVGVRVAFLLFTYELTGAEFFAKYDGESWDRGWKFLNDYVGPDPAPEGRSFRAAMQTSTNSAIQSPMSAANSQYLKGASLANQENNIMQTFAGGDVNNDPDVPFQLSSYASDATATALASGGQLGYDYKLASVDNKNYVVYTAAREEEGHNALDASQLVISQIVDGDAGYALVSPKDSTKTYAAVDDDLTGDTDFDVYSDDSKIYITWMSYNAVTTKEEKLNEAAAKTELKRAVLDTTQNPNTLSDPEKISDQTDPKPPVAMSSTVDDATVYVEPQLYADYETEGSDYDKAFAEYKAYVEKAYVGDNGDNGKFGSADDATKAKMVELMTSTWDMRAQTEGTSSKVHLAFEKTNKSWTTEEILPATVGHRVIGVDLVKTGEKKYLLTYITESNEYINDEYVTRKQLYLASVEVNTSDVVQLGTPMLLKSIIDYDLSGADEGNKDGEIVGTKTEPVDNPIMGYPRFITGKLSNDGEPQTLLVFDYTGNTYMINLEEFISDPATKTFTATPLFKTRKGEDSGRLEANIGTDGNDTVSVVYTSTVRGSSDNAIFVSKFDEDIGDFSAGQVLAMNNLEVYEKSFTDEGREWTSDELSEEYYKNSEKDDGSSTAFAFSNLQTAYSEDNTLLILASGSTSTLKKNQGEVFVDKGSTTTGFYALSFGVDTPSIGNQELSFFQEDFSADSEISAELGFRNTGDVSFRATEEKPLKVSLVAKNDGGKITIDEWEIKETLPVGGTVRLAMQTPKKLEATLPANTEIYAEIAEHASYSSQARVANTSESAYTVKAKIDLKIEDFKASVKRVEGSDVIIDLSFAAKNDGSMASDNTYVQFSRLIPSVDNDEKTYTPLDISGNSLLSSKGGLSAPLDEPEPSVFVLPPLAAGDSTNVTGTIKVKKETFNDLSEGSFNLRAELFDGDGATFNADGQFNGKVDEYNPTNNYVEYPVLPISFFDVAANFMVPMGSLYRLHTSVTTSELATEITVAELPSDVSEPLLGELSYNYSSGYVDVMGKKTGSGIMRIADVSTNSFKDVPFSMTEAGTGINIYLDNGIFTFYNQDKSEYNAENAANEDWKFAANIPSWGVPEMQPLRGDLSQSKKDGAYVEFDSFANKIELSFTGRITVKSSAYSGEFVNGKLYTSTSLKTPVAIEFDKVRLYNSHKITITVGKDSVLDSYSEQYDGNPPVPVSAEGGPTIVWGRSVADAASMQNGQTFSISAYVYDLSEISEVKLNDSAIPENITKITKNLWQVDFAFQQNGFYILSATNKGNASSYEAISLEALATTVKDGTNADAPLFDIAYVDKNDNPVSGFVTETVSLKATPKNEVKYPAGNLTLEVYRLTKDESEKKGYKEEQLTDGIDGLKCTLSKNGVYRVLLKADDKTWSQQIVEAIFYDDKDPVVTLWAQSVEGNADNERSLFYHASKEAAAQERSDSPSLIDSIKLNGIDMTFTKSVIVSGNQTVLYGGAYTLDVVDDAKRSMSTTYTLKNFPLYPQDDVITSISSPTHADNADGKVTIDLEKITGGNYANAADENIPLDEYEGAYRAALVPKENAFAEADLTTNAAKAYFAALSWQDSNVFDALAYGEYVLYLSDATDTDFERCGTIAILDITLVAPPKITTESLPSGVVGTRYSESLSAVGGGEYEWSLVEGEEIKLPDGLSLSSNGVISGTPLTTGEFTFTVKVSGEVDPAEEKEFTIEVAARKQPSVGYTVTLVQPEGGALSASNRNPAEGETVNITLTPDEGLKPNLLTVTDNSGKQLTAKYHGKGNYSFVYEGVPVTVEAELAEIPQYGEWISPFDDVLEGAWYYEVTGLMHQMSLMSGTSKRMFSPNKPLTRAMLVTILYRYAGEPNTTGLTNPFSDVEEGKWYADAIKWAAKNGIVAGVKKDKFAPETAVLRQDLVLILARYMSFMNIELPLAEEYKPFSDDAEISTYAREAVEMFARLGIVSGVGNNTMKPKGYATRAEAAKMLGGFIKAIE